MRKAIKNILLGAESLISVLALIIVQSCGDKSSPVESNVTVTTFAGHKAGYADGTGGTALFSHPWGIATDEQGNVYVADTGNQKIRKISPDGTVTTIAGSTQGYLDGPAAMAKFSNPVDVAVDEHGNIYVVDMGNNKIRKITADGTVSTLAGSTQGYADGPGSTAKFFVPRSVTMGASGKIYVTDSDNNAIRAITADGMVSTLAGGTLGSADGSVRAAGFNFPQGVTTDANGNVLVADYENSRIRKITPVGTVTTMTGKIEGYLDGDVGNALFEKPNGIAVDAIGNIYISEAGSTTGVSTMRIRKISASNAVSTVAGGAAGYANGAGSSAKFDNLMDIAVDSNGVVYVVDYSESVVRKIVIK